MTQTSDTTVEPELRVEPPRSVRFSPPICRLRFGLRAVMGVLWALVLLFAVRDLSELKALRAQGRRVLANVIGKYIVQERGGPLYHLEFEFPANGSNWKGEDRVEQVEWDQKNLGSFLSVVYLPTDPGVHRIGNVITEERVANRMHYWETVGIIVTVFVVGLILLVDWDLRAQQILLRNGIALPAQILTREKVNPNAAASMVRVTYRFIHPSGEVVTRTMPVGPMTAQWMAESKYFTILVDPEHPKRYRPYFQFRAVQIT